MRLLIFLGVIYICYRVLKGWLAPARLLRRQTDAGKPEGKIDDIMIKDPYCEAYFPKRNGIHKKIDGKDFYFCSTECRDKFVALHLKKNDSNS